LKESGRTLAGLDTSRMTEEFLKDVVREAVKWTVYTAESSNF